MVKFLRPGDGMFRILSPGRRCFFSRLPNLRFTQCDLREWPARYADPSWYQPDTPYFTSGRRACPRCRGPDPVTTFESNIMGSLHLFEAVRHMKRLPVSFRRARVRIRSCAGNGAIRVTEEQRFSRYLRTVQQVCLDLLCACIPGYSIRQSTCGFSTPRARARRTMRPRISCGSDSHQEGSATAGDRVVKPAAPPDVPDVS